MLSNEVVMGGPGAADYLRLFSMNVGTDTVTYDTSVAGNPQTPSKRTVGFDLPRVGLASRVLIDIDANFTAVEAAAAGVKPADALAPFSLVQRAQVKIGGSGSLIDLTGVGAHLLADCDGGFSTEAFRTQPWPVASSSWDVQHQVYAYDEATTPPKVTGHARWGLVLPFSLTQGQPLGMVLLGTDRTLARVELTMADINAIVRKAANANPTATVVSVTITCSYEFFEVPGQAAYAAYVQPLLRYAHRLTEDRQDIVSVGPGVNVVNLLPYDSILQVIQYAVINGVLDTTHLSAARLRMNRSTVRDEKNAGTMWRQQREVLGLDVPAIVWHYFERNSLRSAIRAGDYSDIRTEIDIPTGTTIAAGDYISTITRKIVDLGAVAG